MTDDARQILRFFLVSLVGVAADLALAYLLVRAPGLPVILASALSLCAVAALVHALHVRWTFGTPAPLSGTLVAAVIALAIRSAILAATGAALGEEALFLQLLLAVGASFTANYLIVSRAVFRPGAR